MQQTLSSTALEEISGIQNDPIIQSLFEDATGVLCVAGADENVPAAHPSSEQYEAQLQRRIHVRGEKTQNQQKTENNAKKQLEITKSTRRKLERIKAHVTIFRKSKQKEVPSEEEQESAVKRMLSYVSQMPTQEKFLPPPVPFVRILTDESNEAENFTEDKLTSSESVQDYTYLSNDKDVALWKMLVSSPSNCNVFVGGLNHNITSHILHAAFKAFILNQDDKTQLKAYVVMDITRQQSKGYGFVTFPSRRSTELAMICMQDFEIHGRAMQLAWGQENSEDRLSNAKHVRTSLSKGNIVSDTFYPGAANIFSKQSLKRHCSRWDLESPSKCPRIEELAEVDQTSNEIIKEPKEKHLLSDKSQLISSCTGQIVAENLNSSHLKSTQNNRGVQWLTHDQKVALLRSVCSYLRSCGVRGHLGVFGIHYEADNSRLYVVCAKHVPESQLHDEFTVFGDAQVKLNCDANGFSKGCAFVQYTESKCAEKAIKQLHGKVVGGMPMKVMVAEPKVLKGSRKKNPVKL